jgi:hypothetical protein
VKLTKGGGNIATMYTAPSYKAFSTFCNMCEVEMDEDDPIISMVTHPTPLMKMKTLKGKLLNHKHQMLHNKGWIGASLQVHQSHLTLMLLTAPTCQSSLKMKTTLLFMTTLPQSSFAGITS